MTNESEFDARLQEGLQLTDDKKYYFNGFTISISPPDFVIILQNNNEPIAYLNTTHSVAKTLAVKISGILSDFEKSTKHKIPTLDDLKEEIKKKDAKS